MNTPSAEDFLQNLPHYKKTSEVVEHPTLGTFAVFKNAQGEKVVKKHITADELADVDLSIFDRYKGLGYTRIVQFKGITQEKEGNSQGYAVYYEYFGENLKEEIERRCVQNNKFTELEVLKILQNISASLSYMMTSKVYHGEIKSVNIVKVGEDYKVLNPALFGKFLHLVNEPNPNLPKDYKKIVSPEMRHAIYRKVLDPVHEDYKDDVYGLGLIALDLMTLKVDPSIPVIKRLEKANFHYSNTIVRFVKKMTENIISLRLDPVACNAYIEKIQLQHGLVSAQRFSRRTRNHSVMERESAVEEEKAHSKVQVMPAEEKIPVLQKQPSRENRYNRRTESLSPGPAARGWYNCLTIDNPLDTKYVLEPEESKSQNQTNVEIRMTESEFVSGRPSEVVAATASNYLLYAKKMGDFGGRDDSVRSSIASTTITTTQRMTRWEQSNRFSIWDTPRGSTVGDMESPVSRQSRINPQTYNSQYSVSSSANLLMTPQSNQPDYSQGSPSSSVGWRYTGATGVSNVQESLSGRAEQNTRSYPPIETNLVTTTEIESKVSPRFLESKERVKASIQPLEAVKNHNNDYNTQETHHTYRSEEQTGRSQDKQPQNSLFQISMNDLPPSDANGLSREVGEEEVTFVESEQSIDQTFSEPTPEVEEFSPSKQSGFEQKYLSTQSYSVGYGFGQEANLIKQIEQGSPSRTSYQSTYTNPGQQQEVRYFSSYQPRQSYDSFQPKMIKTTVETLSDGSIYEGEVVGFMKQGKGKLTYPDGKYYEGDWKVGKINGNGKLFASNGIIIYDGQWQDGTFHGRGTLFNLRTVSNSRASEIFEREIKVCRKEEGGWIRYNGSFRNGQWEGYGELTLVNEDKYVGDFRKDAINGKGKYLARNGNVWEGRWEDNCLVELSE